MKLRFAFLGLLSLVAVSCSYEESFVPDDNIDNSSAEFYATIDEQPDADTKVYADENLKVLWNADDRITIFNKIAYNQEYRFAGENGDNAGAFKKVPNDDFITGTELDKVYAVYPYRESTKISNSGIITTAIPSEQTYLANSFGRGANTMVACAGDNVLKFKNVGGYLSLKFYGEGVSVSSITLKSNNGELIAGDCTVDMSSGLPVSNLITANASDAITMVCDPPIELPAEKDDAVMTIFVLSPGTLTGGFTVTVNTADGGVFEKSTGNKLEIGRSAITRLGALEVVPEYVHPNNVVYYTTSDGSIVRPHTTDYYSFNNNEGHDARDVFGASIISNDYVEGLGLLVFDGDVTSIGEDAFYDSNLNTIVIPQSVSTIASTAFMGCDKLERFSGRHSSVDEKCLIVSGRLVAFAPKGIRSYTLPVGILSIGKKVFYGNKELKTLVISEGVELIEEQAFELSVLQNIALPESLIETGERWLGGTNVQSIYFPSNVAKIDCQRCSKLKAIEINNPIPASISEYAFDASSSLSSYPIYVPKGKRDQFVSAWPQYSARIKEIGDTPNNVIEYTTVNGSMVTINSSSLYASAWGNTDCIASHTYGQIEFYGPITFIPGDQFLYDTNLKSVRIPDTVTYLSDNCFEGCTSLVDVQLGKYFEKLIWRCFANCVNLVSISLPEGITGIGDEVFYGCTGLTSIVIPESVTSIGEMAFYNCNGLTSITVERLSPPSGKSGMFSSTNNCTIYVPLESVNAYKSAQYWSDYADRIQGLPLGGTFIPVFENVDM